MPEASSSTEVMTQTFLGFPVGINKQFLVRGNSGVLACPCQHCRRRLSPCCCWADGATEEGRRVGALMGMSVMTAACQLGTRSASL